jgi:hypothetical protein
VVGGRERERERKRWDLKACKRAFGRFETLRTKKSIFFFFFFFVYVCACNGLRPRSQGFFATSALSTLEDGPNVHILVSNLKKYVLCHFKGKFYNTINYSHLAHKSLCGISKKIF